MGSNIDLRDQMDNPKVHEVFSYILSGRKGYKAAIERREEPVKCPSCFVILKGGEKFCPECGTKVPPKMQAKG